ncbi:MAG: hypothetical protein M1829_004351 [Trizodia sp. TS-e1964]|nr:MAG: hypothetical protein M1829_004351 [Trizodia sp. TS-e1964]
MSSSSTTTTTTTTFPSCKGPQPRSTLRLGRLSLYFQANAVLDLNKPLPSLPIPSHHRPSNKRHISRCIKMEFQATAAPLTLSNRVYTPIVRRSTAPLSPSSAFFCLSPPEASKVSPVVEEEKFIMETPRLKSRTNSYAVLRSYAQAVEEIEGMGAKRDNNSNISHTSPTQVSQDLFSKGTIRERVARKRYEVKQLEREFKAAAPAFPKKKFSLSGRRFVSAHNFPGLIREKTSREASSFQFQYVGDGICSSASSVYSRDLDGFPYADEESWGMDELKGKKGSKRDSWKRFGNRLSLRFLLCSLPGDL